MKAIRLGVSLLVSGLLAFGAMAAFAQDEAQTLTIEKNAAGFVVPLEAPEGPVTVTIENNADAPAAPLFARLNADVTIEQFAEAFASDPFSALELVALYGGIEVAPNSSASLTLAFAPGTHVLIDFAAEVPAVPSFTVADGEAAAVEPEANVEVNLLDFAFSFPLQLEAGEQTWLIENEGTQWHEFAIARIDDAMSVADLRTFINGITSGEAEPEGDLFFFAPMTPGERAWLNMDLEPGTYVIGCFLPDFHSGHAHAELGMVQIFNVN